MVSTAVLATVQGAGNGDHGGYVSLGVVDGDALYEPPLRPAQLHEEQQHSEQQQQHAPPPAAELGGDARPVP